MAARHRHEPAVSIVIVTHGRWDWALRALAALRTRRPRRSEVLVVDSASPDDTPDRVAAAAPWARLLRLEENVGFGGAVNLGAAETRAPLLCTMNSDAVVRPGWWPAMRRRLDDPGVGAVVPLFVDEDGLVREAGSIVGSDGVTVAWGRGLRADDPAVAFPRDVDYGSAACLLVRADAFRSVGGFHPAYGLGFYEDVELCLDLRERGLRTVYEPRAVVMHPVGRSFGAARATAQSAANRKVFLARRGDSVSDRPALGDPDVAASDLLRARDALTTHRLLLVARGGLDPVVASVARRAATSPATRVTVAVRATPPEVRRLAAAGVEVIAPSEAAVRERHGLATAVVRVDAVGPSRRAVVRAVAAAGVPVPDARTISRDAGCTTR